MAARRRAERARLVTVLEDSPWPLLLLAPPVGYFFARLLHYHALRLLGRDVPFDADVEARGASVIVGASSRQVYAWAMDPVVTALAARAIRPNLLTALCFVSSALSGLCIALGGVTLGGVIGLLGASLDSIDGRIARRAGRVTRAGSFLDSTLDRWGELAFLAGAAVFFRDSPWTLTVCLIALGSGGIVSYTRARAEALGVALSSGLMQRTERVLLFYFGACFGTSLDNLLPPALQGSYNVFRATLFALATLTLYTSLQRTARGYLALARRDDSESE